ncbi:MAG: sterol desaturase family protein [Candidatus Hydrogenedentes bacterium]|nr:sterol desaturase family protein [Candidatus Hydrogenedentota bacterium]
MLNLIEMAIPAFFLLILVEVCLSLLIRRRVYRYTDSINDLSMGIVDQVGGAFLKSIVFAGYLFLFQNYRLFDIPAGSIAAAIGCLAMYDFMYYWAHRSSHDVNIIWGSHIPHHQSEEYNLTVALRQGVFQGCFFWIFYLPLALIGFHPTLFILMASIDTLYQFWIHTRTIGKLGPLEWVLNTPSHHRVHHAKNPKYIDRNHGGILIIWDRIFGTFMEEEEEPIYGTATPLRSWNPVWGQVHYWIDLFKLAWSAPRWQDKLLVWVKRPAWRPQGLEKQGPPAYLTEAFYQKYHPRIPGGLSLYTVFQFIPALLIGTAFLAYESTMTWQTRTGVAGLVIITLVCIGGIFESKRWALHLEIVRHPVMSVTAFIFASIHFGLDSPAGVVAAAFGTVYSTTMLAWVLQYREVFVRAFGPIEESAATTASVEPGRMLVNELSEEGALTPQNEQA